MDTKNLSLGLIGFPVNHSLSPKLHMAALKAMGLSGEYKLYPVPPLPEGREALLETINLIRNGKVNGLNVTVPHKESVIAWVDRLTPLAEAIGAVNTLYIEEDSLVGENTDGQGFWTDICRFIPTSTRLDTALILGAGGSARAVCYMLNRQGYQLAIAARRIEQAQKLAESLSLSACVLGEYTPEGLDRLLKNFRSGLDLIVNCSPLGLYPNTNQSAWPINLPLPDCSLVYDLVYNPARTMLMRRAERKGIPTANGLGMLVEQAALALECWTGRTVPRQVMFSAVPEYNLYSTINSQVKS